MTRVLVDAGPLYAYCASRDKYHLWAGRIAEELSPPLYTCEPVLTEAFWRIAKHGGKIELLWHWIQQRILVVDFCAPNHWPDLHRLMARYADQPMDFADACLVRMSELTAECRVWTTDRDFIIYRRKERLQIPLIFPPD